ncbi:DNA invertase Pin-like site-specific DNA recombinase [Streptomyces sp. KhCrAH-43]|uniref:recombinase family protein n=1 Tax=unclassified Streptomyces TaxID=2593676 RepID=UPI0003753FCA|nr:MULTISPECIES: recombinase family protein [unclassified Streptomyces]MYS37907.1 recombinase family protein [Streptomyces sp. SID4920]MYX66094.1 recombinase family protein [Streptomyces sp. SID8373]RAJ67577.1 DNA invertase Pin-like site-specific DNA recombinase [Streptomyces sp. KhCrAH-43]
MTLSAIYLRLSRESDDSASLETQRAACRRWLEANGHDPAGAVEYVDSNVSGAKPIEAREGLGTLMDARPGVVVAWKLDRFARSVSEFLRLVAWAESRGTRLATSDNAVNTTTPTGRMVATVLASLAEWERSMISDRITDGHATRRAQGRWGAGRAPFGYRIVRRDGAAYLEVEPEQASKVHAGIRELLNGGTVAGTARTVGLSEPQWRRMLKAPTFRGQRNHKGTLVVAADGVTPVQFAEPIISAAELLAVRQRMLDLATGAERAPRQATPRCSEMSSCYRCGGRLNGGTSDKGVPLYRCKGGHVTIYQETLDGRVEGEFLKVFGRFAEVDIHLEGGNDLSAEMIEAREQAARIGAQMATAGPLMLATYEEMSAKLEAAYAALLAAHDPEVREVETPTGRTMGDAWTAADEPGRTRLLRAMGLRVVLHPKSREDRLDVTWERRDPERDALEDAEAQAS